MALTAKRKEELATEIDLASTWILHKGRSGKLRAIAAELRGEDISHETVADLEARLEEARAREVDAAVAAADKHQKAVEAEVASKTTAKAAKA